MLRLRKNLPLLLLVFPLPATITAPPRSHRYEPDPIILTGKLAMAEAYGPPGYGEDPRNDAKESFYYLILESTIDFDQNINDINTPETGIQEVQLVVTDDKAWHSLKKKLHQRIQVKGTAFHAHTGHHHRTILLSLTAVVTP